MHHVVVVDRWSRGSSVLHVREARAKIVVSVALLAAIATTPVDRQTAFAAYFCLLLAGVALARLPLIPLIVRAALVLPFSLTFAAISLLAGDPLRALLLLEKSFLSAIAVLLLVGTTPLPGLLKGLERLGVPRLITLTVQFLYRYLLLLIDQAQRMRMAAQCRGGRSARAGAGLLATLFQRSYERAQGISRAMLSRGFDGTLVLLRDPAFTVVDGLFTIGTIAVTVTLWRIL